ncbi:Transposase, partial [Operophtera brumata]
MVTCAVSWCKNTSAKISKNKDGITFHRFPRDKDRRKRWEIAVNREHDWASTSSSAVCSQHFDANNFYLTERGLRRLSGEAVPTINISYKVRRLEVIADSRKKRLNLMWQSKQRMRKKLERLKSMIKHLAQ